MNSFDDQTSFTSDELIAEFAALFPEGWAGADVLAELAPGGWSVSPLAAVFHPSAAQVHEETVRMHRNMANFPGRKPDAPPLSPAPSLEEIIAEHEASPVDPVLECRELVGRSLWDVFSDNHEVRADDGRLLDLGSARGSGGFLADILNAQGGPPPPAKPDMSAMIDSMFPPSDDPKVAEFMAQMRKEMTGDGGYSYLDFYMGTGMVSHRADLGPIYALIFRRLRARGRDWKYTFPRLYLADFRPLKKQLDQQARGDEPEWANYDPAAALAAEQEDQQHDDKVAEMRESLDEGYREAVEASRDEEPPATVRAYATVYGDFPTGWPPEVE